MQQELNFNLDTENEITPIETVQAESHNGELDNSTKDLITWALNKLRAEGQDRISGNVAQLLMANIKDEPDTRAAAHRAVLYLRNTRDLDVLATVFGKDAFGLHVPELSVDAETLIRTTVETFELMDGECLKRTALAAIRGMLEYGEGERNDQEAAIHYLLSIPEADFQKQFCEKIYYCVEDNVAHLLYEDGDVVTRLSWLTMVYPVGSDFSCAHEHPQGLRIAVPVAQRLATPWDELEGV